MFLKNETNIDTVYESLQIKGVSLTNYAKKSQFTNCVQMKKKVNDPVFIVLNIYLDGNSLLLTFKSIM